MLFHKVGLSAMGEHFLRPLPCALVLNKALCALIYCGAGRMRVAPRGLG